MPSPIEPVVRPAGSTRRAEDRWQDWGGCLGRFSRTGLSPGTGLTCREPYTHNRHVVNKCETQFMDKLNVAVRLTRIEQDMLDVLREHYLANTNGRPVSKGEAVRRAIVSEFARVERTKKRAEAS